MSDVIMRYVHKRILSHAGGKGTLVSKIGTKFWINQAGHKAKQIIKESGVHSV
jgi:hypothetical protein